MQPASALTSTYLVARPRLLRLAKRVLNCPEAASDVAQDTWLRAVEAAPREGNATGFLLRVARNLALDRLRQKTREAIAGDVPAGLADLQACPQRAAADRERLQIVAEAVARLPPRCREAFLLARVQGWTHAAIADRMGISPRTVENHVAFAMLQLRDAVKRSS